MFAALAALVDFIHALSMVLWAMGLPLLFVRRFPRLRRTYAIYAICFVVLSQLSMLLLGECFLTALVRPLWEHAGAVATNEWFTVRVANAVFGLTPSHRMISIASEALVVATALGVLVSSWRSRRGPANGPERTDSCETSLA